ncbi:hypothetical protein NBRC110019_23500 [Neptunitalea chrysea]|uniref:Tetratricopeptide repeat protein n=2 Tax=Neptunitalea chrysea TaxID=1647581 RepID=A0A9W6B8F8_9FLAO|nr:hypothetical protein NBRC110019_23500 [Neptunitalea chrysea]
MSFAQTDLEKGIKLLDSKSYTQAVTFFKEYLNTNEDNLEAHEHLGEAYGYLEDWDNTIEQYKYLVAMVPNSANYHYKYGGALGMKALENKLGSIGLIDDIEDEFIKAAELDKNHIDARWALVKFYVELPRILGGTKSKALHYADELKDISKVDGYLAKGFVYKSYNDFEEAEENLKTAVSIGGSVTCYNKLIALYTSEEDFTKSIITLREAYSKHGKNNYLYEIGKICAEQKMNFNLGTECLNQYIEYYSYNDSYPLEWAYLRLAQLERYQNNKIKAIDYIGKSLAIKGDFKPALKEKSKILKL